MILIGAICEIELRGNSNVVYLVTLLLLQAVNRVFPKVDHSANVDRIVLFESVGSVVESNFC